MNKSKFNIRNYFNGKLFWEAFKQIRIVGLIFFVCLSVIAIFAPILVYSDYYDREETNMMEILLDIGSCTSPLIALAFIAVPIMFVVLFGFQTKRNASDFYHSLPVKRSCQFISYIAAILSWTLIITVTYTLILIISTNLTSEYFVIDYSVLFNYTINLFICSVLILSVFTIGSSITGTLTSNIIMSFGLLLVPRIIIMALMDVVIDNSLTLTSESGLFIFNSNCNLAFAQIFESFLFEPNSGIFGRLSIFTLYSIVLALIYIVIGLRLFITRPSEIATKSFRNKKIFALLKYGTGFIISLFLATELYDPIVSGKYQWISDHLVECLVLIAAIALSMFALEAAFTKSIKSAFKVMLATPIILIVDLVFIYGASALTNYYDNERINPDSVDYVCVEFSYYDYLNNDSSEDYFYYDGYYELQDALDSTKITDKKIIDYLLDIYNSDRADKAYSMPYHGFHEIVVHFDSTFGEKVRYVYLTDVEFNILGQMIFEDENILNNFIDFPDSDSSAIMCNPLTIEQRHKVYETLIRELKNMPKEKLFPELLNVYSNTSNLVNISNLYVLYYRDGKECSYEIPITTLTPESYILYMNYINESARDDALKIFDKVENPDDTTRVYVYADIYDSSSDSDSSIYSYYKEDTDANKLSTTFDIIKDSLISYYNDRKTFTGEDLTSDKYCIADVRILYGHNDYYDYYYEQEGNYIWTNFYLLLPTDSPILDELIVEDMFDDGYDIDTEGDGQIEPESEIESETDAETETKTESETDLNSDFQINSNEQ